MDTRGDRRDGGLKMGWTKPLPRAWPMGIDCRLDLGRGSDGPGSDERAGPSTRKKVEFFTVPIRNANTRACVIALCSGSLPTTFARIGAVVNLRVEDYYPSGKRYLL
jgi:hypothetical protein